jgi:heterodisulfide reductase subunit B
MKRYLLYPGCSLGESQSDCERSLLAVGEALGLELQELAEWNCCGATSATTSENVQTFALAARNLALAEAAGGLELVTVCSSCHLVLNKTRHFMDKYPDVRNRVCDALSGAGLKYQGTVRVRHLMDVILNDVGVQAIADRVTCPPRGMRVAPYYGCQIAQRYANMDQPRSFERLLTAIGADVVEFSSRMRCCGGIQLVEPQAGGMLAVERLLREAHGSAADVVCTICPSCQFNLAGYHERAKGIHKAPSLPVVYVMQLLGLAMGLNPDTLGLTQEIMPAGPVPVRVR